MIFQNQYRLLKHQINTAVPNNIRFRHEDNHGMYIWNINIVEHELALENNIDQRPYIHILKSTHQHINNSF